MAKIKSKKNIKKHRITFSLNSPNAETVILMGDFNHWSPKKHLMKKDGNGVWKKTVMLAPGDYEYKFLVDGQWQTDPQNVHTCPNCFGTFNNVFNLTESSS